MNSIVFENITKAFGSTIAVDNVSLSVNRSEFFFLIGPSGCGKTTLLRMLAGFCKPDSGRIILAGAAITDAPPEKRNITMVFQNYALWPHMTVMQNICFGLEQRKMPRAERRRRAGEVLDIIRMPEKADSRPGELSGGQQQRVALARALVVNPDAVLLDEPLSNLDAKLRTEMRREISRIQKETGVTMLYVTHDQKEALSMGHRIAVINAGRIEQVGTPSQLYSNPATRFVAEFMGTSNVFEATCISKGKTTITAQTPAGILEIDNKLGQINPGEKLTCIIRPERITLSPESTAPISGTVSGIEFMGETSELTVIAGGISLRVLAPGSVPIPAEGTPVGLSIKPSDILAYRN